MTHKRAPNKPCSGGQYPFMCHLLVVFALLPLSYSAQLSFNGATYSPEQSEGSVVIHTVLQNAAKYDVSSNRQPHNGSIITGITFG